MEAIHHCTRFQWTYLRFSIRNEVYHKVFIPESSQLRKCGIKLSGDEANGIRAERFIENGQCNGLSSTRIKCTQATKEHNTYNC